MCHSESGLHARKPESRPSCTVMRRGLGDAAAGLVLLVACVSIALASLVSEDVTILVTDSS